MTNLFSIVDNLYSLIATIFNPLILVFIILVIALFIKRKQVCKVFIVIALILLYLFSTGIVADYFLSDLEKYKPVNYKVINAHKALILLGAGLEKNKSSIQPTILAYSRILEAYRIYNTAKENDIHYKIIITGGDVRKYGTSEAEVYGKTLEDMGVNKDDLILETNSLNTYQNAEYTKKIVQHLPYKQYLLVTSSLHMERSLIYFNRFGINVIPAISDTPKPMANWIPTAYNLVLLSFAIHEYQSILRLYVYDYLNLNKSENKKVFSKAGQ